MPLRRYEVRLIGNGQEATTGIFLLNEEEDREAHRLVLRYRLGEIAVEADDFFEALCKIREQLETVGLRPLCFGSSRNVYPSGMGRDMGRGLKPYRLRWGEPARIEDLVFIFDTDADVEPVTVAEQRAFFDAWLRSPKRRQG